MGTILSPARLAVAQLDGLPLINRGKVRDTYDLGNGRLLIVATDAVSIFDHVLNATIPSKGIVLNLLSHFWFQELGRYGIASHLEAAGTDMERWLPANLRGNPDLLARAMVVRRLEMSPVEFIARGYLTGSGLKAYQETGHVCGHELPKGYLDGDKLPFVLDTPTTKAEVGHDEHLDAGMIRQKYPYQTYLLGKAFQLVWNYLYERGILLADTKLEFGYHPDYSNPHIGDEVFTPDSSRFWERKTWEKLNAARSGKTPPPFDKQVIRNWGLSLGINKRKPESAEDVAWVHQQVVPEELIRIGEQTYRYIFWRITGQTLEHYANTNLGIHLPQWQKRVVVMLGSTSDLPALSKDITGLRERFVGSAFSALPVHVLSCHRNPYELLEFVNNGCDGAHVIVAAGGKAFQLPGILDAFIAAQGLRIPVVGVALGDEHSQAGAAARLSIAEIPGQPVLMNEVAGQVYAGPDGFREAIERIANGELPPPSVREKKPVEFNVVLT